MMLPQEQYNEEMRKRFQHEAGKEFLPQITYQAWLESLNVKLSDDLSKLTEENATLRAENEELKAENAKVTTQNEKLWERVHHYQDEAGL